MPTFESMRIFWVVVAILFLAPAGLGQHDTGEPPDGAVVAPGGNSPEDVRVTLSLPAATWYNDRDANKIFDSLAARFLENPGQPEPTIVTFVEGADVAAAMAAVSVVVPSLAPRYVYHHLGGFAADLRAQEAEAIAALSQVRQVEWSQPGSPEMDTAAETMGVRAVQDLLRPIGQTGNGTGITGEGVVMAIMDTGFDGDHIDLAGQIIGFIDWSVAGAEVPPYDSGNHGTHVASIALGLGAGNPAYAGVAPGAKMIGFRIATDDSKGAALASADWILAHPEQNVRISTLSFGFGFTVDGTDALELAMDRLWEAGVVPFKSNGNFGPARGTVTIPGGARGIISTGAMHDPGEGGLRMWEQASRGPTDDGRIKPDLVAPGAGIMAAAVGTGDGYRSGSGTSMASPFAAGVAALMISADPSLDAVEVRRILQSTAWDWGPVGADIDWGAGQVAGLRAVQATLLERALREGLAWADVAAWNVTGPPHLGQTRLIMAAPASRDTFEVLAPGQPLGITILTEGLTPPSRDTGNRVMSVIVEDAEGSHSVSSPLTAHRRQLSLNWTSAPAGIYDAFASGIDGLSRVSLDVIGAVPITGNPYVLPADEEAYAAMG